MSSPVVKSLTAVTHPVHSLPHQVQRESVGPLDLVVDDHLAVRSVHSGALDARGRSPVGPVHPAVEKKTLFYSKPLTVGAVGDFTHRLDPVQLRVESPDRP